MTAFNFMLEIGEQWRRNKDRFCELERCGAKKLCPSLSAGIRIA